MNAKAITTSADGTPRQARTNKRVVIGADELMIRLISDEATPIYLQIAQQVKHLIITHQLDDGGRLPAVRPLADHLGINPGTVAQAYRELADEQLIETVHGRGTLVRNLSATSEHEADRVQLLTEAAEQFSLRARALGFDLAETRAELNRLALSPATPLTPVVFLASTAAQGRRYASDLNQSFDEHGIEFIPFGIEELSRDEGSLRALLRVAYSVVTFVTHAPEVERFLERTGVSAEVIGVTVTQSDATLRQLQSMTDERSYTLVTEQRAVTTALAEIESASSVDHHSIEVLAAGPDGIVDEAALTLAAESDRIIIFTFGVHAQVEACQLPPERLIEFRFSLSDASLERLNERWPRP